MVKINNYMVLTVKDIARTQKELYDHCVMQAKKKGNDYSGKSEDTFRNIRSAKYFGIVKSDAQACMVQILNKVARMGNQSEPGFVNQITDESLFDTVSDLQNYSTYWLMLMREDKKNESQNRLVNQFSKHKPKSVTRGELISNFPEHGRLKVLKRRGSATTI